MQSTPGKSFDTAKQAPIHNDSELIRVFVIDVASSGQREEQLTREEATRRRAEAEKAGVAGAPRLRPLPAWPPAELPPNTTRPA